MPLHSRSIVNVGPTTFEAIKKYIDNLRKAPLRKVGMPCVWLLSKPLDAFTVYASNGHLPIDNNRVEQPMRQVTLGTEELIVRGER